MVFTSQFLVYRSEKAEGKLQSSPIPKTSDTRRGHSRVAHHSEVCFVFGGLLEMFSVFFANGEGKFGIS